MPETGNCSKIAGEGKRQVFTLGIERDFQKLMPGPHNFYSSRSKRRFAMRPYGNKGLFFILVILVLGSVITIGCANDKWEFFDYFTLSGEYKSEDIEVYLKVEKTKTKGIVTLREKVIAPEEGSTGQELLTSLKEFCMFWTCDAGTYEGSKETGIPVKEQITEYIVDCKDKKYAFIGTAWYGYDGASLGRSYMKPPPERPETDFPSEQDEADQELSVMLNHVCKKYK